VSRMCRARAAPTARGSVQVSPPSGVSPIADTPAQPRRDARHRDVRGHHQAHPGPGGPAAYRSDHRHRHLDQRAHELVQLARERPHGRTRIRRFRARRRERTDVRADAEVRALPREQHGADVRLQCAQRRVHRTQVVEVEGSVPRSTAHGAAQHPPGSRNGTARRARSRSCGFRR
jgi:hypothetical protein